MIKHSVIFKLRYANGSPEEKDFLTAASRLAAIPGVEKFELLRQTSPKNHFHFGIAMEFSTNDRYQHYSQHPDHQNFLDQHWMSGVSDFLEIDYEPILLTESSAFSEPL
jgi:heme-degrading monooxygenase HmoA